MESIRRLVYFKRIKYLFVLFLLTSIVWGCKKEEVEKQVSEVEKQVSQVEEVENEVSQVSEVEKQVSQVGEIEKEVSEVNKQNEKWIFYHDFAIGNYKWQTVYTLLDQSSTPPAKVECWQSWQNKLACTSYVTTIGGECLLQSPWWLDNNHAPPGAGYLNLLFYNYIDTIFSGKIKTLDLRNKTLYLELRSKNLDLKSSKLLFWFQTKALNGKYVNFALVSTPILVDEKKTIVRLKLKNNSSDWVCLGSNNAKLAMYDCVPLDEAMSNVNADFGLIIFPTAGDPDPTMQPQGQIYVKAIGLY